MAQNPRELAYLSLIKAEEATSFSNIEVNTVLNRAKLERNDASLYTLLYLGVIEKRLFLDYVISAYSKTPLEKIDLETKTALRLGIYQLFFCDKIPGFSAVDESVSLAPKRSRGFVNGILRTLIRSNLRVELPKEKWQGVSVKSSIPMEILDIYRASYGDEIAEKIATYKEEKREISLRVNTLKTSCDEVLSLLKERGLNPYLSKIAMDILLCACPISQIKDIIDGGLVFVQDQSSRITTQVLGAVAGDTVLDACACPGGKSFSIAIDMENKGQLYSCDLHESKLSLITKGAKNLGIDIINVLRQDGKSEREDFINKFDKVLCDVPCSGLGVIFKKPEIRYKDISSIKGLPSVQYEILNNCKKYVKSGGTLVYSTCTLSREENEEIIKRFLLENKDFTPSEFSLENINSSGGVYTFLPHITNTDGFFVAKITRK
ncbi:MAG: 16S rRNA (cytosine(967)-C(5))-methyltransferase RsmB [Clostridia bacterium]|nr:16S rRNA (cytosine(967)-C(5))-methyltransferase RsmB [Clostridia bacterium]